MTPTRPPTTPARFRAWRKRMDLTQEEAARRLGISVPGLKLYERGVRFDTGVNVEIPRAVALACWALEHGAPGR